MATSNNINLNNASPHIESGQLVAEPEQFTLLNSNPEETFTVMLTLGRDLDPRFNKQLLRTYEPFVDWVTQLKKSLDLQTEEKDNLTPRHPFHDDPYELKSVHIQAVDFFGTRIGFLKYKAIIQNKRGNRGRPMELPGAIFMRGGSVGMLMILRPKGTKDERWVIMTEQARIPAGSLSFLEIPAGMIDDRTNDFKGAAANEILEETGLGVNREDLTDMTELALRDSPNPEHLKSAMYPSPGGSDEYIALFLWEKEMEKLAIESLREKLTGDRKQGEMIKLKLIRYEDLWKVATRDAKTMVAWALYESLQNAGLIRSGRAGVAGNKRPPSPEPAKDLEHGSNGKLWKRTKI